MPSPLPLPRRLLAAPVAIALASAVALAGCGESTDTSRGRQLFIQQCGSCHVLADADPALFDKGFLSRLVRGQRRGFVNEDRLFALVMFELWRRAFGVSL